MKTNRLGAVLALSIGLMGSTGYGVAQEAEKKEKTFLQKIRPKAIRFVGFPVAGYAAACMLGADHDNALKTSGVCLAGAIITSLPSVVLGGAMVIGVGATLAGARAFYLADLSNGAPIVNTGSTVRVITSSGIRTFTNIFDTMILDFINRHR